MPHLTLPSFNVVVFRVCCLHVFFSYFFPHRIRGCTKQAQIWSAEHRTRTHRQVSAMMQFAFLNVLNSCMILRIWTTVCVPCRCCHAWAYVISDACEMLLHQYVLFVWLTSILHTHSSTCLILRYISVCLSCPKRILVCVSNHDTFVCCSCMVINVTLRQYDIQEDSAIESSYWHASLSQMTQSWVGSDTDWNMDWH